MQSKIDQHEANQSPALSNPTIDFSNAISGKAAADKFVQGLKPQASAPTGGGMMPPTPEAKPLPETPKEHVSDESIFSGIIPTANASENKPKAKTLFSDELDAYDKMKSDGVDDDSAREMIAERRSDLL